jgi:mannose-6-phosphate isomerase-like protein (cupin superfamily)
MSGLFIRRYLIAPEAASDVRLAFGALADAAAYFLRALDTAVANAELPPRVALNTRIRGTGPGVAFGALIDRLVELRPAWQCPFEGSDLVSGAALPASAVLGPQRDDGFLLLRFEPETKDLPLHVHNDSDRFIFVIGGRGFFHVTGDSLDEVHQSPIRHVPARDRDVLMFRRGTVHTFSTGSHPLHLLSYHRPFIPILSPNQYQVSDPPRRPAEFLSGAVGCISFDHGWNALTDH